MNFVLSISFVQTWRGNMADTRVLQRVMSRWFSPNTGVSDAVIHRLHTKEAEYIRLELSLLRIVDRSRWPSGKWSALVSISSFD